MKVGYVAIIGKPNAGKSTLLNAIIGEKLAIVTNKAQTTRKKIVGILSDEESQIIFVDTPGYTQPDDPLNEKLLESARTAIKEVNINLVIVDSHNYMREFSEEILFHLREQNKPAFLVINKVDKIKKAYVLPIIEFYRNHYDFNEIIPLSAKFKDGVELLVNKIREYLPEGESHFDEELISNQPQRLFAEEFIREGIFQNLKQEIPYATYVKLNSFKEEEDKVELQADIFVEKESQKKIVIGRSGSMIKTIREYSCREIQNFLQKNVYLSLWVKVDRNWRKDVDEEKI